MFAVFFCIDNFSGFQIRKTLSYFFHRHLLVYWQNINKYTRSKYKAVILKSFIHKWFFFYGSFSTNFFFKERLLCRTMWEWDNNVIYIFIYFCWYMFIQMYKLIYLSVIIYCTKFFYVYIMLYNYWSTATLIKYINYKSDYLFSTNTNIKQQSD